MVALGRDRALARFGVPASVITDPPLAGSGRSAGVTGHLHLALGGGTEAFTETLTGRLCADLEQW